ncbi:MAG: hypothetical protein CBC40_05535 [bacterium TMED80]|nr:MAG: hypothetical protein CBC40_05535 [bacterium TMED80]|tara:strand:- start:1650 stop:2078 length:429 start_codon:yes stop_codon:yes gene_type:complete
MRKILITILFLVFHSCEDNNADIEMEQSLVNVIASGIIDFQTDAFEVDTMYVHYDILGITVTASYDTGAINISDLYKSVSPGNYVWSGKGITYAIDTASFEIGYDTTEVSGEFSLENGDVCVLTLSVIDSLKIGLTENICTD